MRSSRLPPLCHPRGRKAATRPTPRLLRAACRSIFNANLALTEWYLERALTAPERDQIARIHAAAFGRDPQATLAALRAGQETLANVRLENETQQKAARLQWRLSLMNVQQGLDKNAHLTASEAQTLLEITMRSPDAAAAPKAAAQAAARPGTLATSGKWTLTQTLVNADIAMVERLTRRRLSAGERSDVTAMNVTQFQRDPARIIKVLRQTPTNLTTLRLRRAPDDQAFERKKMLETALFYPERYRNLTPQQVEAMRAIMVRGETIVARDDAQKRVVTLRDVDAHVASVAWLAKLAGARPFDRTSARKRLLADLPTQFAGYDEATRQLLSQAEWRWAGVQFRFPKLPSSVRARAITKIKQDVKRGPTFVPALFDFELNLARYAVSKGKQGFRPDNLAKSRREAAELYALWWRTQMSTGPVSSPSWGNIGR